MHAVQRLFDYRESLGTRQFNSRGYKLERCRRCRIATERCICEYRPHCHSNAAFLLLMYDDEVLKPSNSGRLIADLVPDTHAFLWSRTELSPALKELLEDPGYQPVVVFPGNYAEPPRQVIHQPPPSATDKRPLFILLDGTWREAKKMFRKSPYLNHLPVLSIQLDGSTHQERHRVRTAHTEGQLATAEVAARLLAEMGERHNATVLDLWFDLFSHRIQQGVSGRHQHQGDPLTALQAYVGGDSTC